MNGFDKIISRKKGYTHDQDKVIPPEETVKLALEKIKRYENKHGYSLIKGPYKLDNAFALSQYRIECSPRLNNRHSSIKMTQGKGVTDIQAKASCVMEFIERFSAKEYAGWIKRPYNDFKGNALPFEHIAASLDYKGRDVKELVGEFEKIPLLWGKAYNLSAGNEVYVPQFLFKICTTGLSAGNELEEALLQAICECVERHSGAYIQWYGGEYPTIDRNSIDDNMLLDLIEKVEKRGFELLIKDFSGILGIPVIGVLTIDAKNRDNIGHGIGVCTDKNKAFIRAILESAQGFSTLESARGFSSQICLKNITGSFYFDTYKEMEFLLKGGKINFRDVLDIREDDIKEEIIKCVKILEKKDKEVIFIDLTDEEIGFGVVGVYMKNAYLTYYGRSFPYRLALCQFDNDTPDEAIKNLEKAATLERDKTLIYYYFGCCYQKKEDFRKAIEYFTKALDAHPVYISKPYRNINVNIGECYVRLTEYDKAMESFNAAKAIEKDNSVIYYNLGLCCEGKGKLKDALGFFEKAIELTMSKLDAGELHYEVGYIKKIFGDLPGAEHALKESIRLSPEDKYAKSYNLLGMIYIEKGEHYKAIEILEQGIKYSPDLWENYNLLGVSYRNSGDLHKAVTALEKAISLNPQEWKNYSLLGKIYLGMKLETRGREMLKKAEDLCEDVPGRKNDRYP